MDIIGQRFNRVASRGESRPCSVFTVEVPVCWDCDRVSECRLPRRDMLYHWTAAYMVEETHSQLNYEAGVYYNAAELHMPQVPANSCIHMCN